jgi:hypothetical protein
MPFGAFAWILHVGKDLAADYSPMPSGGSFALREMGHFPSRISVMRWKIDSRRLRRGVLDWRDRELAGEASRMIRRPPVLPVKQASGSASISRREKTKRVNSAKAC